MSRCTYTGILGVTAECHDCGWVAESKNALGLAAQHSDRHGHYVSVEQTLGVSYFPDGHPEHARRLAMKR